MASSGNARTFQQHPKVVELLKEGADDIQAQLAVMVYMDLRNYRDWTDVELRYSTDQHQPYLIGRPAKNAALTTVIPINASQKINFAQMGQFSCLEKANDSSLILALCESDSLIVYYKFSKGICPLSTREQKRILEKVATNNDVDEETQ